LITVAKAMVIRQAWREREIEIAQVEKDSGCDRVKAEWQVQSVFERVQDIV